MSTLRAINLQHPSASSANITLNSNGTMGNASFSNYSGRNRLVNGNFLVWQRGSSLSQLGGAVGVDCWRQYTDTGSGTQTRDSTGYTASDGAYIPVCYRFTVGGSNTNFSLFQIIETLNCHDLAGREVTFSIYLSSSVNRTMRLAINSSTITDAAWTQAFTNIKTETVSVTSTLTKFSTTVTVPSNMKTLQVSIGPDSLLAANSSIFVANAQLELGNRHTPFEYDSYETVLRRCQRYYEVWPSGQRINIGTVAMQNTTTGVGVMFFSQKRAAPTITISGAFRLVGANNGAATTFTVNEISSFQAGTIATGTGYTTGAANLIQSTDAFTGRIEISSEL